MPGYCGAKRLGPNEFMCPDGSTPTLLPDGKGGPIAKPSGESDQVSGEYLWNQDTTPVKLGKEPSKYGYSAGQVEYQPIMSVVAAAKEDFNKLRGAALSPNASASDKKAYQDLVANLRRYTGSKLGTRDAVESAWGDLLKDASRGQVDALELLQSGVSPEAKDKDGSGGGYEGPVSTVTQYAEPDLRLMADQIASTVLGRAVTEQEFKTVLQKVRGLEQENPSVAGAGVASQTNVAGLSQGAREDVITRALLKQDGAEEFTLATKMMDAYRKALQGMPDA